MDRFVVMHSKSGTFYVTASTNRWVSDATAATRFVDLDAAHAMAGRLGGLVCLDQWPIKKTAKHSVTISFLEYVALGALALGLYLAWDIWNDDRFSAGLTMMATSLVGATLLLISQAQKHSAKKQAKTVSGHGYLGMSTDFPVQVLVSGKALPNGQEDKKMLAKWIKFGASSDDFSAAQWNWMAVKKIDGNLHFIE